MKNTIVLAAGLMLIFLAGCRRVNEELVGKMDAESAKVKQYVPEIDSMLNTSSRMLKEMETAPPMLKIRPDLKFGELYMRVRAISERSNAIKALCEETSAKLDSMIRAYSDGTIEEDSVKLAFEAMAPTFAGLAQVKSRMDPIIQETTNNYTKMMETWNAMPESERNRPLTIEEMRQGAAGAASPNSARLDAPAAVRPPGGN